MLIITFQKQKNNFFFFLKKESHQEMHSESPKFYIKNYSYIRVYMSGETVNKNISQYLMVLTNLFPKICFPTGNHPQGI